MLKVWVTRDPHCWYEVWGIKPKWNEKYKFWHSSSPGQSRAARTITCPEDGEKLFGPLVTNQILEVELTAEIISQQEV